MRLRTQVAAIALACAAARGVAAQDAAPATEHKESETREVEVTIETAEDRSAEDVREEEPVKQQGGNAEEARKAEVVRRMRERRAADPRQNAANDDQRAVELYRAHFGGQLTKAPYLGVSTSPVPGALRQHLGLPEGVGLVVDFVESGSPAEAAGLTRYDILTRFNDQVLVNAQQLAVLVRSQKAGEGVKLALIRGGKEQTQSATLVEKDVKPLDEIQYWNVPENASVEFGKLNRFEARAVQSKRSGEDSMVWRDNDMTLTLRRGAGSKDGELVAVDKSGKEIFRGNPEGKGREGMPPEVAKRYAEMRAKGRKGGDEPRGLRLGGSFDFAPADGVNVDASFDFTTGDDQPAEKSEEREFDVRIEPAPGGPIGKNDLLNIDIRDVHGPGVKTVKLARIRDGQVELPYVGAIGAEGLTEAELEKRIVTRYYEAKISPNPKLNVRVRKVGPADQTSEQAPKP